MNGKVLLLNIGNTTTEVATLEAGALSLLRRLPTADLAALSWKDLTGPQFATWPALAACVVPDIRTRFTSSTEAPLTWLTADLVSDLDFSAVDPTTIGADRLANAVAAASGPLPAIVLDCGTAITTEVIDDQRRFLGGMIMPGRRLQRSILQTGTGQLPAVPLGEELPPAIGRDTRTAILSGIDRGIVGAVSRLLTDSAELLGGHGLPAITVGGDREFFLRHVEHTRPGPRDLTLRGLAAVAGHGHLA